MACLNVCPRDALALDGAGIVLEPTRCDGCGLCAAVCPRQVFHLPLNFARGEVAGHGAHFASCERLLAEPLPGRLPCLNAIGLDDLLRARQSGGLAWIVAHGNCQACPRGGEPGWLARVEDLNQALAARGKPGLIVKDLPEARWHALFKSCVPASAVATGGRRLFLCRLLPADDAAIPRDRLLEGDGPRPWSIFIDAWRCVACHACVRTCPENAIRLEERPEPAYRLDHAGCTGCGVCRDVCDRGAVRLLPWRQAEADVVPLRTGTCRACGVDYLSPTAGDARGLCHICIERPDRPRLFRVCD